MTKTPHPIDVHVGSRVRLRRMLTGISQEKLGEALGLTFQQVQKYEKGANRISASRLYEIAAFLDVSVEFFFEGVESVTELSVPGMKEAGDQTDSVMQFVKSSEGLKLNASFSKIKKDDVRKGLVELVKTLH